MDAATRLRADPEVRELIGESERLLRLLFLINAPGSDWSVNEAYQERAFQQALVRVRVRVKANPNPNLTLTQP